MIDVPQEPVHGADHATLAVSERDVLDALPRALIVTDPSGRVAVWNQRAEALYGWDEDEVLGRSIIELLAPPAALA